MWRMDETIEQVLARYRLQVLASRKALNGVRCAGGVITANDVRLDENQVVVNHKHLVLKTILGLTDSFKRMAGLDGLNSRELGYLWMRWVAAAEGQDGAWPIRAQRMLQVRAALSVWWEGLLKAGVYDWLSPLAAPSEMAAGYSLFNEVMGRTGGQYVISAGVGWGDLYGTDYPPGYIGDVGVNKIRNQQLTDALEPLAGLQVFVETESGGYGSFGSAFWFVPRVKLRLALADSRGNPESMIDAEWYRWLNSKYIEGWWGAGLIYSDWNVISQQVIEGEAITNYPPCVVNIWECSPPLINLTGAIHYAPITGGDGKSVPVERFPCADEILLGVGWESELLSLSKLPAHRMRSETLAGWMAGEDARGRGWWDGLLLSPTRDDFSSVQQANDFAPTIRDCLVAAFVCKMSQIWWVFSLPFQAR